MDTSGGTYLIGSTGSADFPILNPFQGTIQGSSSKFVAKFTERCCVGSTGNIDGDVADIVDIADLTFLIDHLFINFPVLGYPAEGNVDGDSGDVVDIADLTSLIDHLFINFPPTAVCQ